MLDAELSAIAELRRRRGIDAPPATGRHPVDRAHAAELHGLAFSGGGIRSAAFNLGVLQGLAGAGRLRRFDYLSMNSGGGYVGGWFAAWVRRAGLGRVERELAGSCNDEDVRHGPRPGLGGDCEPPPVRFLRSFSNYLTPRPGLFTADTWTLIQTYARNLFLNMILLTLALGTLLLIPRLLVLAAVEMASLDDPATVSLAVAAVFLLVGTGMLGVNMVVALRGPHAVLAPWARPLIGSRAIQLSTVLPLLVGAWFLSLYLWFVSVGNGVAVERWLIGTVLGRPGDDSASTQLAAWMLFGAGLYLGLWLLSYASYLWLNRDREERPLVHHIVRIAVLTSAPTGALSGVVLWAIMRLIAAAARGGDTGHHMLQVSPLLVPVMVAQLIIVGAIHLGLEGRAIPEEVRQWWARLAAWMTIHALAWTAVLWIAFYGPMAIVLAGGVASAGLSLGWLASTITGVVVGHGTSLGGDTSRWRRMVIAAAPPVFLVGMLAVVALGLHALLQPPAELLPAGCASFWMPRGDEEPLAVVAARVFDCHSRRLAAGTDPLRTLLCLALFGGGALLLSWRIDINEFSMHLFYRYRLVRAFLGASNPQRRANQFTGLDPEDDLPLADLCEAGYDGPLPIHNAAVNLVHGEELAWQERKAASFAFTPLYSGYVLSARTVETLRLACYGQRPTACYGTKRRGITPASNLGITLGTAMAISGAAVSPSRGAQTTPAMAFLLTVFNVRLGWWLGNPRHRKTWRRLGPRVGLLSLLAELFGHTTERYRYVYLSDGGHFDNTAVYELVRRRCRFILATDAGADPGHTFADLGNLVRKCSTDFGIEIEIDTSALTPEAGCCAAHCAVGRIRYDRVDPGAPVGTLVFLKASMTGDEPADVENFRRQNSQFPHQTTADQWFGEAQFESYRKLGQHAVENALDQS